MYVAKLDEKHHLARRMGFTSLREHELSLDLNNMRDFEHWKEVDEWNPHAPGAKMGRFLVGTTGTGKSELCKALINRWACKEYRAIFITTGEAINKLKNAMNPESGTTPQIETDKLCNVSLLVFDDLGAEKATEYAIGEIFSIFNDRIRNNRHTWFTSNLSGEQIKEKYDLRIYDRIRGHCEPLIFKGTSKRGMVQ